jgi:hypothetical protein
LKGEGSRLKGQGWRVKGHRDLNYQLKKLMERRQRTKAETKKTDKTWQATRQDKMRKDKARQNKETTSFGGDKIHETSFGDEKTSFRDESSYTMKKLFLGMKAVIQCQK